MSFANTKWKVDSPWQDWVSYCRELDSVNEDFDPVEENCPVVMWARSLGDITLKEAVTKHCRNYYGGRAWGWAITLTYHKIPRTLVDSVLYCICENVPAAYMVYRDMDDVLNDYQKRILWYAIFRKKPVTALRMNDDN